MSDDLFFRPQDEPLRRDVRELGAMLGEVLREQHSEDLFRRVEAARGASRARRRGEAGAHDQLREQLSSLPPGLGQEVVRAFSAYFQLVNLAEQVHRIRRGIAYLEPGLPPRPGSFAHALAALGAGGVTAAEVEEAIEELLVEPVFTAHPTEAVRRSLLRKEQRIARAMFERFSADVSSDTERTVAARIRSEVTVAWQTEEHLTVRPSVADEVEHVAFYLTDVLYRVVPRVFTDLEAALADRYGPAAPEVPGSVLRFASWVGGDMDGNPNVGPETLAATLKRHAECIINLYLTEVRELHDVLTQSSSRVAVSATLREKIAANSAELPEVQATVPSRFLGMPYRVMLWFVAARLERLRTGEPGAYSTPEEMIADLEEIETSLRAHGSATAGGFQVRRLRRRVEVFGFHLATLDVRQDALVHRGVLAELLQDPEFPERPAEDRTQALNDALATPPALPGDLSAPSERTLAVFREISAGRARYGAGVMGPYIISMTQGPDDALAVLVLARMAGLGSATEPVPLDVCPLFETVDDLASAAETMAALTKDPRYRAHLSARGDLQHVMLGYSDSNKDSGLAASRWALQVAQRELVDWAEAAGVRLALFHGRGGSLSRGGGKPRDAILAAPPGAVRGRVRVTEQGEIIQAKFGLRGLAVRTLELSLASALERRGGAETAPPAPEPWTQALGTLAGASRSAYRALVYGRPEFPTFFREVTPVDVIERMRIGSRPPSRRGGGGVENLRAIPWVFAWTQCRMALPGWFGLGSGLEAMVAEHGEATTREMVQGCAFFRTLLSDAEMVAAKADMGIAREYLRLCGAEGHSLFEEVEREFERTVKWLLWALEHEQLLAEDPVLARAIRLRNPYVDPMSLLQVDLLERWRGSGRKDEALEAALVTTVQGIARGMQNTG